jgi:hypothetical protein
LGILLIFYPILTPNIQLFACSYQTIVFTLKTTWSTAALLAAKGCPEIQSYF